MVTVVRIGGRYIASIQIRYPRKNMICIEHQNHKETSCPTKDNHNCCGEKQSNRRPVPRLEYSGIPHHPAWYLYSASAGSSMELSPNLRF
jgi:hypothetical protein